MIRFGNVDIVIDERALQELVTSESGPVGRELARIGARVHGTAVGLLTNDMVDVDSGRLRSSTTWKLFTRNGMLGVAVGSSVFYAIIIHDGGTFTVRPHTRRNPSGRGRHRVRGHTRTVVGRPYLVEAARRNGITVA